MKKWSLIAVIVFILVAVAGSIIRKSGGEVCALDGMRIEQIYQVDISSDGKVSRFCCIECARKWLSANKGKVDSVTVTDEITGNRLDTTVAWFVESKVVTNQSTGNRTHVFALKEEAEKHAREFGGTVIKNPFLFP